MIHCTHICQQFTKTLYDLTPHIISYTGGKRTTQVQHHLLEEQHEGLQPQLVICYNAYKKYSPPINFSVLYCFTTRI